MKHLIMKLGALVGATVAVLGVTPAFAAGTTAGTDITNQATVNYSVGSVAQTAVNSNTDSFKVDRIAKLTVVEAAPTTTFTVAPGASGVNAVLTYTVTNNSNAPMDIVLSTVQQTGGAGAHSNTDNFDATGPAIYVESGATAGYQVAEDLAPPSGYLDEVAADASRTIYVVSTIPSSRVTGDVAAIDLVAQAHLGGTAGSQGTAVNATNFPPAAVNGVNTVETVMDDAAGSATGDALRDGKHSAKDDYTVSAAAISVVKTSRVTSDGISPSNPKAIPGATVEYCIAVTNAAGGGTATSVSITDNIPANSTYVAGSARVGATVSAGVCSGGSATNTAYSAGPPAAVSGTIASISAGTTTGFYFSVTIN